MSDAKVNLSTGDVVEWPSQFPLPGALKIKINGQIVARQDADILKRNPRAWYGDPAITQEFDRDEPVIDANGFQTGEFTRIYRDVLRDPCPPILDGFGWFPVIEVRPPLTLGQTYGEPALVADLDAGTVTATYPVVSDQGAIDAAYDALEAELIRSIKAQAGAVILAAYPSWKQSNMTARGVELTRIKAEGGTWSTAEQAEADALDAAWSWVKSIRAASDTAETAVTATKGVEATMRSAAIVDWENI